MIRMKLENPRGSAIAMRAHGAVVADARCLVCGMMFTSTNLDELEQWMVDHDETEHQGE